MIRRLLFSCMLMASLGIPDVWAHHQVAGRVHPAVTTVRITQPVLAGGQPLAAGTYELVVTDERPPAPSGEPNESQRWVEFLSGRQVVAREIAEVFPASERPIGTSSASGAPRAVVQRLKTDNIMRVAVNTADARYLIHMPLSQP
jgi:hypothetical protein